MADDKIGVICPKNAKHKTLLSEGLEEDDNEDIAYINIRLIYPVLVTYGLVIFCITMAIYLGHNEQIMDLAPRNNPTRNIFLLRYGSLRYICKDNNLPKPDSWPSMLRMFELKAKMNTWIRYAVVIPIMIRFLITCCSKKNRSENEWIIKYKFLTIINNSTPYIIFFETLFCSLFSIITLRHDFPEITNICLHMFVYLAIVYMFIHAILSFLAKPNSSTIIDHFSIGAKVVSFVVFVWFIPKVLQYEIFFMTNLQCNEYVPFHVAFSEYMVFIAYITYHASHITEIRHVRFQCYPRTSSGECEPIRQENFAKDGRYAHCRSYELRQRQLKNINNNNCEKY
uniref:Post-GPI attachment to proteins factor 2-like n=1 Tax=Rhabditophanes sp. KR3021 TaxID=114890 RepID=A0AC35TP50_9BILA